MRYVTWDLINEYIQSIVWAVERVIRITFEDFPMIHENDTPTNQHTNVYTPGNRIVYILFFLHTLPLSEFRARSVLQSLVNISRILPPLMTLSKTSPIELLKNLPPLVKPFRILCFHASLSRTFHSHAVPAHTYFAHYVIFSSHPPTLVHPNLTLLNHVHPTLAHPDLTAPAILVFSEQ